MENNTYYDNSSDAKHADLTFTAYRYTNDPGTITHYGVVPTAESPHYDTVDFVTPVVEETTGPFRIDVNTKELK